MTIYFLRRLRPAAAIFAILRAPYFLRPIDAANAPGLRMPLRPSLRFNDAKRLPLPNLALRAIVASHCSLRLRTHHALDQ